MTEYIDNFILTDVKPLILERCGEVYALLRKSYWADERTIDAMRRAMENSLNFAVFDTVSDRLVGYARVVTDYATVYYLTDVYIDEAYRGKGLGTHLVEWICVHEDKLAGINGLLRSTTPISRRKMITGNGRSDTD